MKRLLILIALAAVVWGAFYLMPKEEQEAPAPETGEWKAWDAGEIDSLAVDAQGFSYVLKREGEGFIVALPEESVTPPADIAKIETLADFISGNPPMRRLGRFDDPATFGLEFPQVAVTLNDAFLLEIGDMNPSKDGVYAEIDNDGELVLLAAEYLERLNKNANAYYDLGLTDVQVDDLGGLRLQAADGETWEIRMQDGKWAFAAPESLTEAPVSTSDVEVYLHQILNLRADGLLLGLELPDADPLLELTLLGEAGKELDRIRIFAMFDDGFVGTCKRLPALFSLSGNTMGLLTKSSFSLKDRRIVQLDTGKIMRVDLASGERSATFTKQDGTGGTWRSETNGTEEEMTGIDMLLWRLTDLKYESDPVDALPEGLSEELTVRIFHDAEVPVKTVTFHASDNGNSESSFLSMDEEGVYYPVADDVRQDYLRLLPPTAKEDQ